MPEPRDGDVGVDCREGNAPLHVTAAVDDMHLAEPGCAHGERATDGSDGGAEAVPAVDRAGRRRPDRLERREGVERHGAEGAVAHCPDRNDTAGLRDGAGVHGAGGGEHVAPGEDLLRGGGAGAEETQHGEISFGAVPWAGHERQRSWPA